MYFSNEQVRKIALGKIQFKKCPACDNNGLEYWDDGGSPQPFPHPSWGNNYTWGNCENCKGIGYIDYEI